MIEFANCLIDRNVFPSFLMSTDLTSHVDNEDVISDFLKVRKKDKGKKKTNVIGWHSNIKLQDPEYPHLCKVMDLAGSFCNQFLENEETNLHITDMWCWLMENGAGAYNVVHNHGKMDLIGVYYIEVPPKAEGMTLLRTDAFTHTALCGSNNSSNYAIDFNVDAIVGRLYIMPGHLYHFVRPFDDTGYRRSLVFNIGCGKKKD